MNIDKLIIGLGNPGKQYSETRHNIGYMVANALISKYKGGYNINNVANFSMVKINNQNILVALPLTYMNCSGKAAVYFLDEYKIATSDMLIILDEYNFPVNKIHIKKVTSNGGHNGIASILSETEADDFYILRCGIDRNFGTNELSDYVLSPFSVDEQEAVEAMIDNTVKAVEFYINNKTAKALSYINSKKYLSEL
jgi:PTH1 family peptidyl-tRNA hydrolase